MIKAGSKIGIVCCSDGQKREYAEKIGQLEAVLKSIGLQPVFSDHIYVSKEGFSSTAQERAAALMNFYRDDEIKGIFDISGGDLANGILPYLDYDVIADFRDRVYARSHGQDIIAGKLQRDGGPDGGILVPDGTAWRFSEGGGYPAGNFYRNAGEAV